jgi:hypothetical protein
VPPYLCTPILTKKLRRGQGEEGFGGAWVVEVETKAREESGVSAREGVAVFGEGRTGWTRVNGAKTASTRDHRQKVSHSCFSSSLHACFSALIDFGTPSPPSTFPSCVTTCSLQLRKKNDWQSDSIKAERGNGQRGRNKVGREKGWKHRLPA